MLGGSDQLHSYQFTLRRVVGALALRDPDPVSSPMRRIGGSLVAGVLLAALAAGAVGGYGLLRPGGDGSWREGASVIVERETGARFVYVDGVLHPVLNYSSALLILGSQGPPTALVSRGSLAGVPRGAPLGIAGAPDLLPAARDLLTDPWTVCSRAATALDGTPTTQSVLLIGPRSEAPVEPLGLRGLLAQDPTGDLHLIWNNHRFAIRDPAVVLTALAWRGQPPTAVSTAALNSIPAGADLSPVRLDGTGRTSTLAGVRVGEVVVVANQSGTRQYAVAMRTGLAEITEVQADILVATGVELRRMTPAEYASAPAARSPFPSGETAWPAIAPDLARARAGSGLCAFFTDGAGPPRVGLVSALPGQPGEVRPAGLPDDPASSAGVDRVVIAPGRGAVVEALATAGSPSGSLSFVSDLGLRYSIPSTDVLGLLGYHGVAPQRLPAALVALLPSGPALDPAAARLAVAGT